MKKIITLFTLVGVVILLQSSVKSGKFSSQPPTGYSGASGDYCTSCHGSFAVNSGGGGVSVTGLPTGTFVSGQAYNFSLTISHASANRQKWGFSIAAVNASGQLVGTFSSTNGNAGVNGSELSHSGAVSTSPSSSYTYTNLKWTAPTNPPTANKNVTFYFVGNAANGTGGTDGDYIYSNSVAVALPIELKDFTASVDGSNVALKWETTSEINSDRFEIEKSDNGQTYYTIGTVKAAVTSNTTNIYSYVDSKASYFEKPVLYRLKMIDKDNSFKYSKTVSVKLKATSLMVKNVYPTFINRAGAEVTSIITSDKAVTMNIQLLNANGKLLQTVTKAVEVGENMVRFTPPSNLINGTYYIRYQTASFNQTIAVLVQK